MNEKPEQRKQPFSSQNKKFLFDLHNFDPVEEEEVDLIEEEIEAEPPPPTFSEEEIEAAKTIAHAQGVNQGRGEEKQQRNQFIAETLNKISESFSSLFAAEVYREKQYEEEALKLGLAIISFLAPSLDNHLGKDALKEAISNVLKRQEKQAEIRIEVDPESTADIDQYIETIWTDKDDAPRCKVVANNTLEKGACQIHWEDGGMARDPQKTARELKEVIESLLTEQVAMKNNSSLTTKENNAIKEAGSSDSLEKSAPEVSSENSDGENKND